MEGGSKRRRVWVVRWGERKKRRRKGERRGREGGRRKKVEGGRLKMGGERRIKKATKEERG